jgi:hypothetical protein
MAHFAELDENNIVINVVPTGNEFELNGEELNQQVTGNIWKRTSYNTVNGTHLLGGTPFRGNYAAIGYKYNEELDAFIPPKPFSSWVLNESIFNWEPPIPKPDASIAWQWDEENIQWVELPTPQE